MATRYSALESPTHLAEQIQLCAKCIHSLLIKVTMMVLDVGRGGLKACWHC